jgi:hypothetical protein
MPGSCTLDPLLQHRGHLLTRGRGRQRPTTTATWQACPHGAGGLQRAAWAEGARGGSTLADTGLCGPLRAPPAGQLLSLCWCAVVPFCGGEHVLEVSQPKLWVGQHFLNGCCQLLVREDGVKESCNVEARQASDEWLTSRRVGWGTPVPLTVQTLRGFLSPRAPEELAQPCVTRSAYGMLVESTLRLLLRYLSLSRPRDDALQHAIGEPRSGAGLQPITSFVDTRSVAVVI